MDFSIPARSSNRSHFTTKQKLQILAEYDKCIERGSKSEFARRIGVGYRTLYQWSVDRDAGALTSRSDSSEGDAVEQRLNAGNRKQLTDLQAENERLKAKLAKSEAAVDILGKASALLDAMAKSAASTEPLTGEQTRPAWLTREPSEDCGSDSSGA